MNTRFELDVAKAAANLRKHGISFEAATQVFGDPLAQMQQDRVENGEQRWRTIGVADGFILLIVAHTVWVDGPDAHTVQVIRIISARRAEPRERREYEQEDGQL